MDSYISVIESIKHASWAHNREPVITWLSAEAYEKNRGSLKELGQFDGIIVPGGFGTRGVEGKIRAIEFCRTRKIPYFGLCFGMQLAVIEYARNVCGMHDATSGECDPHAPTKVIDFLPGQNEKLDKGGTLRLGSCASLLNKSSKAYGLYKNHMISERHRHRYEVNPAYHDILQKNGLNIAGCSPDQKLVEFICIESHPYFLATQAHPELKSRLEAPAPLFLGLVQAAIEKKYGSKA